MAHWKPRYRFAEGRNWIEVRVRNPMQLFDAKDPAPFRERDLDDDFVEYIVASAREISDSNPLGLAIYIDKFEDPLLTADSIKEAITHFFEYKIEILTGDLRNFLQRSQYFLMVGIFLLGICLWVAQQLGGSSVDGIRSIIREGVVIIGWVSMWKPIELLLFDWFPIYQMKSLYKKLNESEIRISNG